MKMRARLSLENQKRGWCFLLPRSFLKVKVKGRSTATCDSQRISLGFPGQQFIATHFF